MRPQRIEIGSGTAKPKVIEGKTAKAAWLPMRCKTTGVPDRLTVRHFPFGAQTRRLLVCPPALR